jgi:GxxExxY protein
MHIDQLTDEVIAEAIAIHRHIGPGAFESAYEAFMNAGLVRRGLRVERQAVFPVEYAGVTLDLGYRIDLVVEDQLLVELKCTERPSAVHKQQLLSYLRLSKRQVGLLINFGLPRAIDGITRVVNGYTVPPDTSL